LNSLFQVALFLPSYEPVVCPFLRALRPSSMIRGRTILWQASHYR
jgi:hypothetical protein